MQHIWDIAERIDEETSKQFPEMNPVVVQLLQNRGLTDQEEIDVFLGPDWKRDTHDPFLFDRMDAAVERVSKALENKETITIHGDYDADGVCGTAVMVSAIEMVGEALGFDPDVTTYIPHREKEGYGMSVETVNHLHEHDETDLIITVDCGISNKDAVAEANGLGIDTIVTDHHTVPDDLPDAILIHPKVPGESYPFKELCGTAVAFKLAHALILWAQKQGADLSPGYEKWLLDLVGIATITDVMPLHGENRVLEKFGQLVINKTRRIGLKALLKVSGSADEEADSTTIGYRIGPRLNAAGRMTHANEALQLLLSDDMEEAEGLAKDLESTNRERQKLSRKMFQDALDRIDDPQDTAMLSVIEKDWSPGLVGLVAGKLVSEFHRPAFVVGHAGGKFVGSGRGVGGFDITEALKAADAHLDSYGGHPQACGFSTHSRDDLESALEVMRAYVEEHIPQEALRPGLKIDMELPLEAINWNVYEDLQSFRPFGEGNSQPLFASKGVSLMSTDTVGQNGKHLRLAVQSPNGKIWKAIGFGFGEWGERLSLGDEVDIAYHIGVNEWKGNRTIQLKLKDIKLHEKSEEAYEQEEA